MAAVVVLGASGRAGAQVAAALAQAGAEVVWAGRDTDRLQSAAKRAGYPQATIAHVDVTDDETLLAAVSGASVVVNTVGPFITLGGPVVEACLQAGVSYVDVGNEQPWAHSLLEQDAVAREVGVCLVTGAGLGLTGAETLTRHLLRACPARSTQVRTALGTWNSSPSAGVRASTAAAMQVGATRYVDGELVHEQLGAQVWSVELLGRQRTLIAAPMGDVEAVFRASGAGQVAAFVEAPPGAGIDGEDAQSVVHVEITDVSGQVTNATRYPGDSLIATTRIATATALGVLQSARPGAWTPAGLLGVELFLPILG